MEAALLNIPGDERGWNLWSYPHRVSHARIAQAVQARYGVFLADYQVDPFRLPGKAEQYQLLQRHQRAHQEFNAVLGLQSSDIEDVDLDDRRALIAWTALHHQEHWDAETALGI